jgi:hypothetical protein
VNLKLRHVEPPDRPDPGTAPPSGVASTNAAMPTRASEAAPSIGGWLGVFATMLPRRQAESIREELETHLSDRVRDLMVGGLNEAESTKRAIAELGEAAELAGKYRALANEPRRRIAMYGTVFAVAGAALALSIASVSGSKQPEAELAKAKAESETVKNLLVDTLVRVQPDPLIVRDVLARAQVDGHLTLVPRFYTGQASLPATFFDQPPAPELDNIKIDVNFEETPAKDVFQLVAKSAGMPVQVNWSQLESAGFPMDTRVTLQAKQAGAAVILRAVNEARIGNESPDNHVPAVDWRARNGVLVVALRDYFDRQEVKLVIYDLDRIIAARQEKYNEDREKIVEEVSKLVTEFVSPTGWRDNGGDLAKMSVVGDRMFVEAPERFHAQIKWMLEQLPGEKPRKEGNAGEDIQRYIIQHIGAIEALNALKANQAIKAIDFSKFFADDRTNSVLGRVSPEQHAMVKAVLGQIDTEQAAKGRSSERGPAPDKQDNALPAGQVIYVTGPVSRPGVYGATDGLTLRRLLAAAGGLPSGAVEVVISNSADGKATVSQTVMAEELKALEGPDPVLKGGQLVSVR